MKSKTKNPKHHERTPIADGDARPDHQEDALKAGEKKSREDNKKLTAERGADTDSLEDFKDAK